MIDDNIRRWSFSRKECPYTTCEDRATWEEFQDSMFIHSDLKNLLRKMPYQKFLQTWYWHAVCAKVRLDGGYTCCHCGTPTFLQVHHKTYEHHGEEHKYLGDLMLLCKNCHAKLHSKEGK